MVCFYSFDCGAVVVPLRGLNRYEKSRLFWRPLCVVCCVVYSSVDGLKIRFISLYLALFGIL